VRINGNVQNDDVDVGIATTDRIQAFEMWVFKCGLFENARLKAKLVHNVFWESCECSEMLIGFSFTHQLQDMQQGNISQTSNEMQTRMGP